MSNFIIGVSYGSYIQSPENIFDVKKWANAKLIEIPVSDYAVSVARSFVELGYECGLHIPSKELVGQMPWLLNVQNLEQVDLLIKSLKEYLCTDFRWKYVVTHYPLITKHTDKELIYSLNRHYLSSLTKLIKSKNIPLYVENVAVNSMCFRAEDYDWPLSVCDGLCYDIGHAHTAGAVLFEQYTDFDLTEKFFNRFKNQIRCIHLYNATYNPNHGYSVNTHYPFVDLGVEKGFMNIDKIVDVVNSLPQLKYIVHEPHRCAMDVVKTHNSTYKENLECYYDLFSKLS